MPCSIFKCFKKIVEEVIPVIEKVVPIIIEEVIPIIEKVI